MSNFAPTAYAFWPAGTPRPGPDDEVVEFVERPQEPTPPLEIHTPIDLEDALSRVPREARNLLSAQVLSAFTRDQIQAAVQEMDGLADRLAGDSECTTADVPDWVRLGHLDVFLKWMKGDARTCLHAPHPDRPEPLFAVAWRPGIVVCRQCPHMLKVTGKKDKTCDACGHVCTGEDGDTIRSLMLQSGLLTYMAGACRDCAPADDDNGGPT